MRFNRIGRWLVIAFSACTGATCLAAPDRPSTSAADVLTREVLRKPVRKLDEGATTSADLGLAIHRNLPTILEQNFAARSSRDLEAMVSGLSELELGDLAQLYVDAVSDANHRPVLLHLAASRLSGRTLGRLSKHFGFSPVYEAVVQSAPGKAHEFLAHSHATNPAPTPGNFGRHRRFAGTALHLPGASHSFDHLQTTRSFGMLKTGFMRTQGVGQYLFHTPYEIYLSFRTAPVGSLGVSGALYETATLLGKQAAFWFAAGYSAGTVISNLIQTYAPELHTTIGGTIAGMVDNYDTAAGLAQQGEWQGAAAAVFGLTPLQRSAVFDSLGGDFGVAYEWWYIEYGSSLCGRDRYTNCFEN